MNSFSSAQPCTHSLVQSWSGPSYHCDNTSYTSPTIVGQQGECSCAHKQSTIPVTLFQHPSARPPPLLCHYKVTFLLVTYTKLATTPSSLSAGSCKLNLLLSFWAHAVQFLHTKSDLLKSFQSQLPTYHSEAKVAMVAFRKGSTIRHFTPAKSLSKS